jgi:penicillin amidase
MNRFWQTAAAMLGSLGLRRWLLGRVLPPAHENLSVPGLQGEVKIHFDRQGVPHIYGNTEADLFFGQGYCHARDRLWQMELSRHVARGEVAGLLGERALEVDRFLRRMGFGRSADKEARELSPPSRAFLDAYCAGVNAWVANHRLPIEFGLLRYRPRPWEIVDTLAFSRFMGWTLTFNWESELVRARLIAAIGPERTAALEPGATASAVPFACGSMLPPVLESARAFAPLAGLVGGASNNWVAAGSRTGTGRPLLASDPHLRPRMPPAWYVVHLQGGELDVIGATLPGTLGVLIGHNAHIAWGITAGLTDGQDLYVEKSNGQGHFQCGDRWLPAERCREEFRVKGRTEPVVDEFLRSRHGPILNGTLDIPADGAPLAMACVLEMSPSPSEAIVQLNRARDWPSFRAALSAWAFPVLNFVYADIAGNIGFQMAGRIPRRNQGDGYAPLPGWDRNYDWLGMVPFDELPQVYNPSDGVFATANTRPAAPCAHYLARDWADDGRWRRIMECLQAKEKHSLGDFQSLQNDVLSLPGREVAQRLVAALASGGRQLPDAPPKQGADASRSPQQAALQALATWDGRMSPDSLAAAVYVVFGWQLRRQLCSDLPEKLLGYVQGQGIHEVLAAVSAFHYHRSSNLLGYLDDDRGRAAIPAAFAATLQELAQRLGPDPRTWQWGRLHAILFGHPIGLAVPFLDRLLGLSRGPYPVGGDADTVAQAGIDPWQLYSAATYTVSYRQVIDVGNWDASGFILPTGQSGQPGSGHYDDQVEAWRGGELAPLLFSRAAVEAAVEALVELRPPGK